MFTDVSCREFTEILSSKSPVPGGGGASALVGALAVALGNMVGNLTLGKKKYADVEEEIKTLIKKGDALREELMALVEKDAEVFRPLSKAYGLPTETEEERSEKEKVMAIALKDASLVPLEIMRKCCDSIDLLTELAEKGSRLALSDAGVGATFAKAALQGASLNVFINTKLMKDRVLAEELEGEADKMLEEYTVKAELVFRNVMNHLRK
ncbi:MAG: cyclodeaminase/cyclohydrolase family protein [Eubacteriaceae bacterium]|nr:cyclodeaminase/cyclohydrolase family protein [Eubacteriaceae bacterium]